MTCAEFQRELPDFIDEGGSAEFQSHLKVCASCSGLVASLQSIAQEARLLQASEEPSPRVWNSIEIILRQEKLIRQPDSGARHSILPTFRQKWGVMGWLVPVAAVLLVGVGVLLYQHPNAGQAARQQASVKTAPPAKFAGDQSDEQLLQEVSVRAPMMRAAYERNLKDVNEYIRDAQESVNANPNDEEAQQALMDAYGQKSMIYEMALDRSLP
jgi:hypothetical protein